jgi:hypothetical protein
MITEKDYQFQNFINSKLTEILQTKFPYHGKTDIEKGVAHLRKRIDENELFGMAIRKTPERELRHIIPKLDFSIIQKISRTHGVNFKSSTWKMFMQAGLNQGIEGQNLPFGFIPYIVAIQQDDDDLFFFTLEKVQTRIHVNEYGTIQTLMVLIDNCKTRCANPLSILKIYGATLFNSIADCSYTFNRNPNKITLVIEKIAEMLDTPYTPKPTGSLHTYLALKKEMENKELKDILCLQNC